MELIYKRFVLYQSVLLRFIMLATKYKKVNGVKIRLRFQFWFCFSVFIETGHQRQARSMFCFLWHTQRFIATWARCQKPSLVRFQLTNTDLATVELQVFAVSKHTGKWTLRYIYFTVLLVKKYHPNTCWLAPNGLGCSRYSKQWNARIENQPFIEEFHRWDLSCK